MITLLKHLHQKRTQTLCVKSSLGQCLTNFNFRMICSMKGVIFRKGRVMKSPPYLITVLACSQIDSQKYVTKCNNQNEYSMYFSPAITSKDKKIMMHPIDYKTKTNFFFYNKKLNPISRKKKSGAKGLLLPLAGGNF